MKHLVPWSPSRAGCSSSNAFLTPTSHGRDTFSSTCETNTPPRSSARRGSGHGNNADERDAYVKVDVDVFKRLIAAINQSMDFEDQHGI